MADFGKANLTNANLRGANLTNADLRGANLTNANLRGANLTNADLRSANLTSADLREANLTDVFLIEALLKDTNLSEADLEGANLGSTDLRGASLVGANLKGVDFSKANLLDVLIDDKAITQVDDHTTWPNGFDYQSAVRMAHKKQGSQKDRPHIVLYEPKEDSEEEEPEDSTYYPKDIGVETEDSIYFTEDDKKELRSIDGLMEKDIAWILSHSFVDNEDLINRQREALSCDDFFSEIMDWLERIFEGRISQEEIEDVLAKIRQAEEAEIKKDKQLWQEIQKLPKEDREGLEKIDIARRKLREKNRSLPNDIIMKLLDNSGNVSP